MRAIIRYETAGIEKTWPLDVNCTEDGTIDQTEMLRLWKILKQAELYEYYIKGTKPRIISITPATDEEIKDWYQQYEAWIARGRKGIIGGKK